MLNLHQIIADELSVKNTQVAAAVALLDEGATVPFISRYRKEVTGGLDDTQLRHLEERLTYLRELEERREAILKSIKEQEKLTPELEKAIKAADTKTRLEDLYLPYKQKRRTKAQIAREAGIEPLADLLFQDPSKNPEEEAAAFINEEAKFADTKAVLDGAKQILMERFAEDADLIEKIRTLMKNDAHIFAKLVEGKEKEGAKFRDYFDHHEAVKDTPSHRALAIFRGRKEGFLSINVDLADLEEASSHPCEAIIADHTGIKNEQRAADKWLNEVVRWTWRVKLSLHMETELLADLRERAEEAAISVFAKNLSALLMAAPAGQKATIGLDPGLRTGVKVAVIDHTGQLVDYTTIYPHAPQNKWDDAIHTLAALAAKHKVELVAIGNGTASRETDKLTADLMKQFKQLNLTKIIVNEAGASVYSASEFAAKEFPDLDVTFRGAASIARRLQDPLAELVKIEPKSIGVGQYQHDVSQTRLARQLDAVVEDCVNAVGVDVNTASAPLLARIAGLNQTIASNIVTFRNKNGSFKTRDALKDIPRLGDKTFEQAAGFLRIMNGDNLLDSSAVHPEAYAVVERIVEKNQREIGSVIGDATFLKQLAANDYVDDTFGLPTVTDIITELEKPGRDPRPEFKAAEFTDGVETLKDLKEGMVLEGNVTNVTNFGAFVDIGVHQDGLVHISALTDKFVSDPHEVVKTGDIVKVKVMEVDLERKRIGLSMRLGDVPGQAGKGKPRSVSNGNGKGKSQNAGQRKNQSRGNNRPQQQSKGTLGSLFNADQLAELKKAVKK